MGRIKVNVDLLPIKSHYFFFMAAMGPILPQMSVYGKEMGISSVVMGTVTGILPILFLIAKPIFGIIVDVYRKHRKTIFLCLIATMAVSFASIYVLPPRALETYTITKECQQMDTCNVTELHVTNANECNNSTIEMICTCAIDPVNHIELPLTRHIADNLILNQTENKYCTSANLTAVCGGYSKECQWKCVENTESNSSCLYKTWQFWYFIILMSIGMIGFNVTNSISDAICFDVIGDEYDYGKQRVWGTIGFGTTAFISGYFVNWASNGTTTYGPAFLIMLLFTGLDLFACSKLKLPVMETPENIFKDLCNLLQNRHTVVFVTFSVFAGVLDGFIVYFLFWYLEDLAVTSNTSQIKLIEGLIVAAETLGGEVIFFSISGKILERFGHGHCFSMCFINYALRLGLISVVPSPWWAIPVEFLLQGPTYALTYTTIVAYANAIAPPGASATMQGIAAGMDDGFGYAIGSLLGGFLYQTVGGQQAFQVFCVLGLVCSVTHLFLYKYFLQHHISPDRQQNGEYKSPGEAALALDDTSTASIHCI
ncbi:major facilitator superfamily domain-containing protein 6 [Atheta coriaria]|uniref:major facilitator superfamily domain-containing protein 6 n=1 Tax=Dalotia coriaria TaxID=877792 RepID=UPI0031F36026